MQAQSELKDFMHGLDDGDIGDYGHEDMGNNTFHNDYLNMDDDEGYKAYLVQQEQMSQLP